MAIAMNSIYLTKAVSLHLGSLDQAAVTRYELGTVIYKMYKTKRFGNQRLRLRKSFPELNDLSNAIRHLLNQGILSYDQDFPSNWVFRILGRQDIPAEDIACTVDQFAFVSHLSAMDYHGLTDRLPTTLHLSSPIEKLWRDLAFQRTKKDCAGFLEEYLQIGFPTLRRIAMYKIRQRPVQRKGVSDFHGAYRTVQGRAFRVTTLGRTFLDMLREPVLCGGINHVLDVFDNHSRRYLSLIVDEIDKKGSPIDKIRAGYILDERCSVEHPTIQQWLQFAQRGGSRKLDAKSDYSSTFSEKWSLSINVIGA